MRSRFVRFARRVAYVGTKGCSRPRSSIGGGLVGSWVPQDDGAAAFGMSRIGVPDTRIIGDRAAANFSRSSVNLLYRWGKMYYIQGSNL